MSSLVELRGIELRPVVELSPSTFSRQSRTSPSGTLQEMPAEWDRYWRASLADSGISDINAIAPGSWHVATTEFSVAQLETHLVCILDEEGGLSSLDDPDLRMPLGGGLALCSTDNGVIVEPTCCSDLGNIAEWRTAATFQGEHWEMLWIGHPWLSMMFRNPWLLLSEPHESDDPAERWALKPDELGQAVSAAEDELTRFSEMVAAALVNCGYNGDALTTSLQLAGLGDE